MTWQFWAGLAVGAILSFIVVVVAQATGVNKLSAAFAAEDAARAAGAAELAAIEQRRDEAHATIEQLTADEIDRIFHGAATLSDVMRARAGKPAG